MFDFSVYIGPAVAVAGILLALVAFGVFGGRAMRESMDEAVAAAKAERADKVKLPPLMDGAQHERANAEHFEDCADLERTAEFGQPSAEVPEHGALPEVDFDAAIARITADLAAAEAADEENAADLPMVDEDIEATRMLKADDRAAIFREETAEDSVVAEAAENSAIDDMADMKDMADNVIEELADDAENSAENSIESTLVMPKLTDEDLATDAAVSEDVLDKIALEETRVLTGELAEEAEQDAATFGEGAEEEPHKDSLFPESPVPFGPKMAWLAIPGYKPSEVISALRLGDVAPANWTKGLTEAYADNNQVFVSPALSGWVLVIGKTLWQKADMNRSAENIQWLKEVGRLFGNACFFSTMRGLGNHGWVGIRGGNIVRAYGYSGELQELIWLLGDPTEEEIAVNPAFANEVQEREMPDFRPVIPDEKMVLAMAAGWSVDVSFRNRKYLPDYGFIGKLE